MTLNTALAVVTGSQQHSAVCGVSLVCGFQPLHLATFLAAHVANRRASSRPDISVGVFGDLAGNLARAADSGSSSAVIAIEWSDLDPRLGARSSIAWSLAEVNSILEGCRGACQRLLPMIQALGATRPVAVIAFTLPLLPVEHTHSAQAGAIELNLDRLAADFRAGCAALQGVSVVSPQALDEVSPRAQRLDLKADLLAGFPYTISHAEALAGLAARLLFPLAPKKGLITDLDNTLWKGIVGEIGAQKLAWDVPSHAQTHGLYQQMLTRLADQGVLIAVASKNELSNVEEAFQRDDLYVSREKFFPVEANWGPKSASTAAILKAWNIGADSVVFIDDSELELSEVQASYPEMTCIRFDGRSADASIALLRQLRELFGKPAVLEEDRLRSESLRNTTALEMERASGDPGQFLAGVNGVIRLEYGVASGDARPLELINKTNQFNLNGERITEGEWLARLRSPRTVVLVVSYSDRFGRLGKIATLAGSLSESALIVDHWVMSCRAFSRMIEHHVLQAIFERYGVDAIQLRFQPTPKNQPLQEFLSQLSPLPEAGGTVTITSTAWRGAGFTLPHATEEFDPAYE